MMLMDSNVNKKEIEIYIAWLGEKTMKHSFKTAQALRENGFKVFIDTTEKTMKNHIKKALNMEMTHMIIIGENEMEEGLYTVKNLIKNEQKKENINSIINNLKEEVI